MSTHADVFEPNTVRAILKDLEGSASAKEKFGKSWKTNVDKRIKSWSSHKENKSTPIFQLEWEAEVIEYVDYIYSKLSVHGNSNALAKEAARTIAKNIPLLGPRFIPPSFLHCMRREATPKLKPQQAYTKALTIVHPVFYPTTFLNCPQCDSLEILWDGWNGTGARSVYGTRINERAIGYQLRCKNCKETDAPGGYCFATTNCIYWEKWAHWKIPRSIPYFLKRTAVTHELFDLITELRPASTSAGLAESLKQLHLLEHRQRMLEYLSYFKSARRNHFERNNLLEFSAPTDEDGYGDSFITNDLITDLYLDFIAKVRKSESIEYSKTRTARCISLDNTFKSSGKATIIDSDGGRQNPMKGGILSTINEEGEGLSWRYCMSASPAETREMLEDLGKRHDAIGVPRPIAVIVDNCCQVRRFVREGLGQETSVCLDVYHFIIRYGAVIHGGTKNARRCEVLLDIRNSIIKIPAKKNKPAKYWTQPEQEIRLAEAYDKWLQHGGIWSAAASKVHIDQLEHVQKGCLSRHREDIAMDGSRIEGSHKAWNSLQRSQPSGIEMYTGLAFDFFLRRNIRIGSSRIENNRLSINLSGFVASTHSSHHVQLISYTAELFNFLYAKEPPASKASLSTYPTLPQVDVIEMIGLVESMHSLTFGGLVETKTDTSNVDESILLEDIDAQIAEMDENQLIRSLGIDERLRSVLLNTKDTPSQITRGPEATTSFASTATNGLSHIQKRKERSTSISTNSELPGEREDTPVDPKRRRCTGPFSPNTQAAIGVPSSTPFSNDVEVNEVLLLDDDMSVTNDSFSMDCEPTDATTDGDIALPNPPSTSSTNAHAFFQFQTTLDTSASISRAPVLSAVSTSPGPQPAATRPNQQQQPSLEALRRPLLLPPALRAQGLTRSQLLFSIGTLIDPRALKITGDDEFYLFMDMRAEYQWTSFGMTGPKWASATKIYNNRLEELAKGKDIQIIKKSPRALMDKLSDIEPKISDRILSKNYICTSRASKTDTFWWKHCYTVAAFLGRTEGSSSGTNSSSIGAGGSDAPQLKKRKSPVCTCCKTTMYPGDKSLNHLKGVCADGAPQKAKPKSDSESPRADLSVPEWPQPQGIFIAGKSFNPAKFLFTVRDLYERVTDHLMHNPAIPFDYTLEDEAFSRMLSSRTIVRDGHSFFQLYDLEFTTGSVCESLVSKFEDRRYLRMDCL